MLSRFFIDRPIFATVLSVVITLIGGIALYYLPMAQYPRITPPGALSYSSLELPDGNWGNLIVLDGPPAREQWRTGSRHAYAAEELAPRHYTVIRLHRGRVDGGLRDEPRLVLEETAYHDFRGPSPWRAVRRIHGGSH